MMYNRNTRPRIFCIVYITLGKKPNSLSSYEAQVSEMHKRFKHADARIFSKDFLCFFFFMYVMLTSSMSLILNHIYMHVHNACEYVRNFENFSYTSVSHSLRANEADELGSACTHRLQKYCSNTPPSSQMRFTKCSGLCILGSLGA